MQTQATGDVRLSQLIAKHKWMKKQLKHLYANSSDITNTARNAGIPYRTFATAALMNRYADDKQLTDGEPLSLWDIIWKTRLALSGVESCDPEREDEFEVYFVELLSPVKGTTEPECIQVQAVLHREAEGGAKLLLKLKDEA